MTTDPRTMTTEQLRDWLARDGGWTITSVPLLHRDGTYEVWVSPAGEVGHINIGNPQACPTPDTLDAAAAAMPEGWWWEKCYGMYAAVPNGGVLKCHGIMADDTGDEKHDRFLLAVLARIAQKGEKHGK